MAWRRSIRPVEQMVKSAPLIPVPLPISPTVRHGGSDKRKTRPKPGFPCCLVPLAPARRPGGLHRLDFVGLQALLALHNLERNLLAFLERLEAAALDRTEVDEDVRAAFRGDEAKALGVVEPLNGTGLTIRHFETP